MKLVQTTGSETATSAAAAEPTVLSDAAMDAPAINATVAPIAVVKNEEVVKNHATIAIEQMLRTHLESLKSHIAKRDRESLFQESLNFAFGIFTIIFDNNKTYDSFKDYVMALCRCMPECKTNVPEADKELYDSFKKHFDDMNYLNYLDTKPCPPKIDVYPTLINLLKAYANYTPGNAQHLNMIKQKVNLTSVSSRFVR